MPTDIRRRTPEALRALARRLPAPERVYHIDGVIFEIYKAKEPFQPHWNHGVLRTLVREARKSFLRYGSIPLEDVFDTKAAVYLVRAQYILKEHAPLLFPVEEWLTLRFIPAHGAPYFTEDIEACLLRGRPIRQHIAERFFSSAEQALRSTVTTSRLCGIKPYFAKASVFPLYKEVLPRKHQYLSLSFVLLNYVFFDSVQTDPYKKDIITMMFHAKLLPKVTDITLGDTRVPLPITQVHEFFGERQEHISIDRSILSYAYPSYWLDIDQLLRVLVLFTQRGVFPPYIPQWYLHTPHSFAELQHRYSKEPLRVLRHLRKLGSLLTVDGTIQGTRIHGTQFRQYLDAHVADAPQLHVMPVAVWVAQLEYVLSHAKRFSTEPYHTYAHTPQNTRLQSWR